MMNDYPKPLWEGRRRNFVMQYADDFTQIIVTKCNRIDDRARKEHRDNVENEISWQNEFERKWKIKTNLNKFKVIMIANKSKKGLVIENVTVEYEKKANILGLSFNSNNFFRCQVDENIKNARSELRKLYRLRSFKQKLKVRLYKTKVLSVLTYASGPLNICSRTQIKRL